MAQVLKNVGISEGIRSDQSDYEQQKRGKETNAVFHLFVERYERWGRSKPAYPSGPILAYRFT